MPYKKDNTPFVEMTELIRGKGLTPPKLAVIWMCSTPTARDKLNNPDRITLRDLELLHRFGHIGKDAIFGAIKL